METARKDAKLSDRIVDPLSFILEVKKYLTFTRSVKRSFRSVYTRLVFLVIFQAFGIYVILKAPVKIRIFWTAPESSLGQDAAIVPVNSTSRNNSVLTVQLQFFSAGEEVNMEGPRYDIDQEAFDPPELFEKEKEVFHCDRTHWRTDVCTLKGDVRVDARRNLAVLYAKEPQTRRGVEVIKPYTRKWETEMMKGVNDVVLASVDAPEDLQPQNPMPSKNLSTLQSLVAKVGLQKYNGTVHFGNSSSWSEEDWRQMRTEQLIGAETQLGLFDYQRQEIGAQLAERGGKKDMVERHGWVEFSREKYVTGEEVEKGTETLKCDVTHKVPGVLFANSGYTGNIYHEFSDGLIPLYITTDHLDGEFVMILEFAKLWWFVKYESVLRQLSKYPAVLLGKEELTHCFPHLIVGLRIHNELTVYPHMMPKRRPGTGTILHFQSKLERAWDEMKCFQLPSGGSGLNCFSEASGGKLKLKGGSTKDAGARLKTCRPLLTLLARKESRAITNQPDVVILAQKMGFRVQVLSPDKDVYLPWLWGRIRGKPGANAKGVWGEDLQEAEGGEGIVGRVTMGVHGAAMTHLLFAKEGDAFVQILPLGTLWPGKTFYGDPAIRMGLHYKEYRVRPRESSLSKIYKWYDKRLRKPESVVQNSWPMLKEIYLDSQNVTIDLRRMRKLLRGIKYEMTRSLSYKHELKEKKKLGECQ